MTDAETNRRTRRDTLSRDGWGAEVVVTAPTWCGIGDAVSVEPPPQHIAEDAA